MPPPDPRPLPGEPLALDLLDTQFVLEGELVDLLAAPGTCAAWRHHALGPEAGAAGADGDAARAPLVEARAAIRAVAVAVPGPVPPEAREALDRALAPGRVRRSLGPDGRPAVAVEVDDPAWRPAVLAAYDLLDILAEHPDRIRQCEHEKCVLWFLDTSRNGTRRWCTMARCGNRAKAERHYRRVQRRRATS